MTSPVFASGMDPRTPFFDEEFFRLNRVPKESLLPMPAATTLRIAIGDYPHTLPLKRGEIVSPWLKLDFVEVKPMHKAFKPMVREHAYDASEMALVTYLAGESPQQGLDAAAGRDAGALSARLHALQCRARQAHSRRSAGLPHRRARL